MNEVSMKTRSVLAVVREVLDQPWIVLLLLVALAGAQSTPVSTNLLSATLNGPVQTIETPTTNNTSNNVVYTSSNAGVAQALGIRTINAPGIAVDQASLDVYAADALKGGKTQDDRRDISTQGHISVYVNAHFTDNGTVIRRRALTIILNSRTVVIILQQAPAANDDGGVKDWDALMNSLVINQKTCWLPEGCN
jgi:hypothetical protein